MKFNNFYNGLANLGNTCYMNTVLQTLLHTKSLSKYFLTLNKEELISIKQNQITYSYLRLLLKYIQKNKQNILPLTFKRNFQEKVSYFYGNNQHDAQEFFTFLIDNFENKKISDIFYGKFKKIITCQNCDHQFNRSEPFLTISLPICKTDKKTLDLHDLFKDFFKDEILTYECENCKKREECIQKLEISKFPKILSLQLKRFTYNNTKNKEYIKIPEIFTHNKKEYKLYSIVNHSGNCNSGHYYNYSKIQSEWYVFNDSQIGILSKQNFNTPDNYVLFYKSK